MAGLPTSSRAATWQGAGAEASADPGESVFPAPVFHGDTIRVETEVLKRRASSSRPNQGVVTFEHRVFNQDDVLVCRTVRNALMLCRPGGG